MTLFPKTKAFIRDVLRQYAARTESLNNVASAIVTHNSAITAIEKNTKFLVDVERGKLTRAGHKPPSEN
jgi:hypothetical protein